MLCKSDKPSIIIIIIKQLTGLVHHMNVCGTTLLLFSDSFRRQQACSRHHYCNPADLFGMTNVVISC